MDATIARKTLQEHLEYVQGMTRLELWFVRDWLRRHPDEEFTHTVRQRTGIFLKTDLYDGRRFKAIEWTDPRWLELEDRLRILLDSGTGPDGDRFEEKGLAVFRPHLEAKARSDFARAGRPAFLPDAKVCGCLWYTPPEGDEHRLFFHIYNSCQPLSIFSDERYVPRCLLRLMEQASSEFGVRGVWTTTWLNSYPPWLACFGPAWETSRGPEMTGPTAGMGFWGQFVNGRGLLNEKHAAVLRKTSRFPYWPREAGCGLDELREHIASRWPGLQPLE